MGYELCNGQKSGIKSAFKNVKAGCKMLVKLTPRSSSYQGIVIDFNDVTENDSFTLGQRHYDATDGHFTQKKFLCEKNIM